MTAYYRVKQQAKRGGRRREDPENHSDKSEYRDHDVSVLVKRGMAKSSMGF